MSSNKKETTTIARSPYAKKIGFTCGSFDLIHPGHIMMLEEAKSVCDILVVGVQSDPSVDRPGKNKPIQTHEERLIMVSAVRYVDEVVSYDTEADLLLLLRKLHPDIRIIGSDHKGKEYTGHELSIKVHYNSRDHDWSTTNLRKLVYESEKAVIDWNKARQ
jgi:glycerol-3-phosphate cytidylyltransferase